MTELAHHFTMYEPDLEIIRAAITAAKQAWNQQLSGVGVEFFVLPARGPKIFILLESDVHVIANGLVALQNMPEFQFQGAKFNQYDAVCHCFKRHLGKEFIR